MKSQSYYITMLPIMSDMSVDDKFIYVNCAGIFSETLPFSADMPLGRNDYYVQYLKSGTIKVYFEDSVKIMNAGDMIIYYPHTPYKYDLYANTEYYWVHFSGSEAENLINNCGFKNHTIYNIGINQKIILHFEKLFQDFISRDNFFELSLAQSLMRICLDMARSINMGVSDVSDERINRIISFIHRNYNKDISVASLAASEYMSEGHLRALFNKRCGISPKQYITSLRISTAKQLLEQSDITIAEAAESVGISDSLYFSRIFKQYTGKSPSEYRKSPTDTV